MGRQGRREDRLCAQRFALTMNRFRNFELYWNTVRYLRPAQVHGRIRRHLVRSPPDLAAPPRLRPFNSEAWVRPAEREPSLEGPRRFSFLNEAHDIAARRWDGATDDKLWSYNLNYFDDLNARNASARREWHLALLEDWVSETCPGQGVCWEPYPTSLRIVNWIKWALGGNPLPDACVASLAIQARWITKNLETHLLGNHLFANAKALVFAGLFFHGGEADSWLELGLSLLAREVPEQILADGAQFELSPMYHSLALEDMLDLINVTRAYGGRFATKWTSAIEDWPLVAGRMRDWLLHMCHPDGGIAFFNDAAIGIAPSPAEIEDYARRLGLGSRPKPGPGIRHLEGSGYVRLTKGSMVALLDVARVGPDYLPGHAHADTLSFELSLGGQRVLVNSGTSCYGVSDERLRQRGTDAHNTVVVNGKDSSEVWSGFRVARRARPFGIQVLSDPMSVSCSHDGYRRLAGRPVHRRSWTVFEESLSVQDHVIGRDHGSVAYFHFHPDIQPEALATAKLGRARLRDGRIFTWQVFQGEARLEPTTWHPRFGESVPTTRLAVALHGGRSAITFNCGS